MRGIIDVHVARLRGKVDGRYEKRLIKTVLGIGFVVREDTNDHGLQERRLKPREW
ncbi:MAG: hypothetical protein DMG38_23030 [Acidobacteria bacterium]|nr:MAG: hypothetical protein DMG38_23030 [Acidobacteriota bacterium]